MFAGVPSRLPSGDGMDRRRRRSAWVAPCGFALAAAIGSAFLLGRVTGARGTGMDTSAASRPRPSQPPDPVLVEYEGACHAVLALAVAEDGRLRYLIDSVYGIPEWVDAAAVRVRTQV